MSIFDKIFGLNNQPKDPDADIRRSDGTVPTAEEKQEEVINMIKEMEEQSKQEDQSTSSEEDK